MPLIEIQNLSVNRDGQDILQNISMSIDKGEIVTIVGPNGSGKTTLLRLMIGAVQPNAGAIVKQPDLRIGYVPQKLHLSPTLPLSVDRFLSLPKSVTRDQKEQVLASVHAEGLMSRKLNNLSGGQVQRVLLAKALLNNPNLILLDEPTQGLDQPGSATFYQLIDDIRSQLSCAVLMVSHELHVVMSRSDRVICLNGHICCHGTPETVSNAPEYRALFGAHTGGALALYRHDHDHGHDHDHTH